MESFCRGVATCHLCVLNRVPGWQLSSCTCRWAAKRPGGAGSLVAGFVLCPLRGRLCPVWCAVTHLESSEARATLCILENRTELSSEKKDSQNLPSLLGDSPSWTTDS